MTSLANQFDRAAAHYNEAAEPQRLVIDRLVQLLDEHLPKAERHFAHAFEMGSGSGLLTERIDQLVEVDHWTLADLSPALLAQVPRLSDPHPELRVEDASGLSLEGLGIDLFVSSSAIQWLANPCAYLQRTVLELAAKATVAVSAPATVKKSIVSDMNKCYYPDSFVVPFIDIVHDRAVEEIFRGCIRGCRFCQAGFIYRPIREKSVETINRQSKALIDSTGYDELSLCSLSTSDHSCVNEMLTSLIDWTVRDKINLSLPSLRVDNFSDELVDKLSKVRRSGLTFAPEAGTQRMRDVINKNVTEEEVLRTCTKAFAGGWTSVKLYFMMGLPTETMEDIAGIAQLAGKVVDAYYNTPEHKKGCAVSVSVSCASFIPKPFTPFQWEPEDTMTSLKAKQAHLLESVPSRKIRVSYHETPTSLLEGVLARGDRRLSKVLLRAFELGCKFDSWDDHFNFDAWMQAFEECGLDPDFYTKRRRPFEELLPWDHLDYGVSRKFLELENKRAHQNVTTPHCRIRCAGCGANKLNGGHCDARPEVARDTTAVQ